LDNGPRRKHRFETTKFPLDAFLTMRGRCTSCWQAVAFNGFSVRQTSIRTSPACRPAIPMAGNGRQSAAVRTACPPALASRESATDRMSSACGRACWRKTRTFPGFEDFPDIPIERPGSLSRSLFHHTSHPYGSVRRQAGRNASPQA
jgi:hypothetical protein